MMADSIQSTAGGALRGLGRQRLVLALNILGFWVLAVPIGSLLTFVADIGVKGLVSFNSFPSYTETIMIYCSALTCFHL